MQGLNLCTLAAAALLMISKDSLAWVSARPRCPSPSALPRIKYLTLLHTRLGHSLAVTQLELPCPLPSPVPQPGVWKSTSKGDIEEIRDFIRDSLPTL